MIGRSMLTWKVACLSGRSFAYRWLIMTCFVDPF
jgi:hypothetical protein